MGKTTEEGHLFVLVHGLWGGASHLRAIEETIHSTVSDSTEKICTIRPKSSALFKTYDGIEIVGQRMLIEVLQEVQHLLHVDGIAITKISFVGYSLGGLISRYIIGELEKLKFFETVEPQYFTTFASPHLGVCFFKPRYRILNILGTSLLGLVGRELFISDQGKILVQLSEGDYIKGLERFKKRFLFANIRHDRSVNFYTAYITNKNPFEQHWDQLDLKFDFDEDLLSTYTVRGIDIKPRIVNLQKSTFRDENYQPEKPTIGRRLEYAGVLLLVCCVLPFWIPIVFTASTIGSITSYFIVKTYKGPDIDALRDLANSKNINKSEGSEISDNEEEDNEPFQERMEDATGEALENQYEIFQKTEALPLDKDREYILQNLNNLNWIKFAVYVNVLNAHDGIIARKGLKKSTVKGVATVYFWGELINREIKGEQIK
ncbi:hypothetical protein WICANDRAFT_34343 [Wickerhamomyces anomalus NRRL Y-366-8]|uniref:DUF676 domain-containing protein n=1 Tax=Wickerhamomyces anomalus (strain ATCC 58044 / CBS 1984 / NCYC 433 / NRRL Y-366-8) TaxID=683960 RepID=A0A1E3NXX8_WICAA|nr:uncharacterized protein WICANDRAFT_34343 [Wickerhamomyces anomalus NRRL Y-366-8]ODQ57953.1 hypothetical protein WICANDRAFT_34343 [Wickerhamomyces anomalus NRRL Y-366-8]